MTPGNGSQCDYCPSGRHYLLRCPTCAHQWEEPPLLADFTCPQCGTDLVVTAAEHAAWERAVGTAPASDVSA
jgi:hypothetical protein